MRRHHFSWRFQADGCKKLKSFHLGENYSLEDEGLKYLCGLEHLTSLDVSGSEVSDDGIAFIVASTMGQHHLTDLNVSCCPRVTDIVMKILSALHQLRHINISSFCDDITDFGVQCLLQGSSENEHCVQLKTFVAELTTMTDAGLQILAASPTAKALTALLLPTSLSITPLGCQSIAELEQLTNLDVSGYPVSEETLLLVIARRLTKLETLNVDGDGVTDLVVREVVRNNPLLSKLILNSCAFVSDAALMHIRDAKMSHLKHLEIASTENITSSGLMNMACRGQVSSTLTSLNLANARSPSGNGEQVLAACEHFCALRTLNLSSM